MNYWYIREGAEHEVTQEYQHPSRGWSVFVMYSDYEEAVAEVSAARQAEQNAFRNRDSAIAENEKLRAALTDISKDNFLYRSTQIAINALATVDGEVNER